MAAGPQKLRVFISSTVYDLIDVRAELSAHLAAMGVTPVLSDDKLSDFRVQQEMNSIATCLVNVESCDEFILILDRRYGPKLGKAGFDDVSATHLEYRHAIASGRPIHVFVRDRMAAEYSIWKQNKRSEAIGFPWVKEEDLGLFELLDEHAKLSAERQRSNWYSTFANSVDLKAALTNHLNPSILPQKVVEAIQDNRFPLLSIELQTTVEKVATPLTRRGGERRLMKFASRLKNIGRSPAFNCVVSWGGAATEASDRTIMAPGQSIVLTFLKWDDEPVERTILAEYESATGVLVRDTFMVHGQRQGSAFLSGGVIKQRDFIRSAMPAVQIQEPRDQESDGQHLQAD